MKASGQKPIFQEFELNRIQNILKDVLEEDSLVDFDKQIDLLKSKIHDCFEEAEEIRQERPLRLFVKSLYKYFRDYELPKSYSITEYGVAIISNNQESISKAHFIQKVAYIDTPMLLGILSKNKHWDDVIYNLIEADESKDFIDYNREIYAHISDDIIKGETSYENSESSPMKDNFVYKRKDGSEFNLLDCATGVKSFAILQILLKNGFLNKYTLLIIDEPESHLHPQWIIEYARLIVLLNKHIGVNFFLASHNPDMVSAIKYISEKEEVDNKLNFYIAQREQDSYTYLYKHLGTDIEPIFESFNIALDRISEYGTKEEE